MLQKHFHVYTYIHMNQWLCKITQSQQKDKRVISKSGEKGSISPTTTTFH